MSKIGKKRQGALKRRGITNEGIRITREGVLNPGGPYLLPRHEGEKGFDSARKLGFGGGKQLKKGGYPVSNLICGWVSLEK